MTREALRSDPVEPYGCVHLYREGDGTYTVEHKDLYRVYSQVTGLTRREAREEYRIYLNR